MKSSLKLTDLNSVTSSGDGIRDEDYKGRKGCSVGIGGIVAIVVAAAVVATIVGLLVFYLHPDRKTTDDVPIITTTTTTECVDCLTSTTEIPIIDYRLPNDLVPYFYDARLRPNFYHTNVPNDSYTNGSVKITFGVRSPTKQIVLHSKTLVVDNASIQVEDEEGGNLPYISTSYDTRREFYTILMKEVLDTGKNYTVYMKFNCTLKTDLAGIYLSSYKDVNGRTICYCGCGGSDGGGDGGVYIVTSQAEATEARKMFPCFDEPALKAIFNLTFERKNDWTSFSNTQIDQSIPIEWVADKYLPTPPMSTYLLAVVISQFECVNSTTESGDVLVSVCSRTEYIDQTAFANSVAANMQDYYVNYYNISYPLQKMEHMAVPDFSAGAMENWGLILYRETALLYDDQSSSAFNKQRVAIIVAHELAHQWFGNLVTPQWWDDIWLNEGFASYMEITCTDHSFPDWDMVGVDGQFVVDDLQGVFKIDSLVSSHPVYQEVSDPAQINELFDEIAYSKTAQKRGKPDVNVTEIMQTWLLQIGYPVINVTYDNNTGVMELEQEHFLLNRNETPPMSPYNYQWIVPISIVTSNNPNFTEATQSWLNSTTGSIKVQPNLEWIILNSMQQYYYRVNYNDLMWNYLIFQLIKDHKVIHSNTRAQLIDDSFNLGRAGYLNMEIFLEITKYLTNETEYVPWRAVWKDMIFMKMMFEFSGNYEYLRKYVQQQVEPIYKSIGWNSSGEYDHLRERHRGIILDMACSYGYEDCLMKAADQFNNWMDQYNSTNPIDPNVRAVTYCSGIEAGGSTEWHFGWERFLTAPSSSEETTILRSLACTKEIFLLSGYLAKALALDGIRLQDFSTVVISVAENPIGRSMAWDFVRQNWNQLVIWFKDSAFTLPNIIREVTLSFSTELELTELELFKANSDTLSTATRAVDQAIENTKSNIDWRQKNEEGIVKWLKENRLSVTYQNGSQINTKSCGFDSVFREDEHRDNEFDSVFREDEHRDNEFDSVFREDEHRDNEFDSVFREDEHRDNEFDSVFREDEHRDNEFDSVFREDEHRDNEFDSVFREDEHRDNEFDSVFREDEHRDNEFDSVFREDEHRDNEFNNDFSFQFTLTYFYNLYFIH
ncbi:hypothetical protein LSH36_1529g00014 [Paralvinella palmiformis]|uniref:Aminopeptidase n=1 Tax=Paralvinella palmiformis TaxID=53620 RepID=A0AAD9ITU6_9ANNE|nr:hypothetical protein LSH36_1529g00014 [Paralvinella palmiformis]